MAASRRASKPVSEKHRATRSPRLITGQGDVASGGSKTRAAESTRPRAAQRPRPGKSKQTKQTTVVDYTSGCRCKRCIDAELRKLGYAREALDRKEALLKRTKVAANHGGAQPRARGQRPNGADIRELQRARPVSKPKSGGASKTSVSVKARKPKPKSRSVWTVGSAGAPGTGRRS